MKKVSRNFLFEARQAASRPPKLVVPDKIILLPLPRKSHQLNSAAYIWPYMLDNWLSIGVFSDYEQIVVGGHSCRVLFGTLTGEHNTNGQDEDQEIQP